jgi:DNA-binding MarR family transcriptional regulator
MTKIVRGLEARGLVERFVPDDDRRSVLLRLTPEGETLLAPLRARLKQIDLDVIAMLPPEERQVLIDILMKVIGWEGGHAG